MRVPKHFTEMIPVPQYSIHTSIELNNPTSDEQGYTYQQSNMQQNCFSAQSASQTDLRHHTAQKQQYEVEDNNVNAIDCAHVHNEDFDSDDESIPPRNKAEFRRGSCQEGPSTSFPCDPTFSYPLTWEEPHDGNQVMLVDSRSAEFVEVSQHFVNSSACGGALIVQQVSLTLRVAAVVKFSFACSDHLESPVLLAMFDISPD